jgi:hypothetical protein
MLFRWKTVQTELIEVIGDPHASEQDWMSACNAIGDQELVNVGKPALRRAWLIPARLLAVAAVSAGSLGIWLTVAAVVSALIGLTTIDDDLATHLIPFDLGLFFTFIGMFAFWRRFCRTSEGKMPLSSYFLLVLLIWFEYLIFSEHNWSPHLVVLPVLTLLFLISMTSLAAKARKALPATFPVERTLFALAFSAAPFIAVIALLIFGPDHMTDAIDLPDNFIGNTLTMLVVFGMSFVPSFVAIRASRITSLDSALAVNAVLNAPVLLAIFVSVFLTVVYNPNPVDGIRITVASSVFVGMLATMASIAAGSYIGVRSNRRLLINLHPAVSPVSNHIMD